MKKLFSLSINYEDFTCNFTSVSQVNKITISVRYSLVYHGLHGVETIVALMSSGDRVVNAGVGRGGPGEPQVGLPASKYWSSGAAERQTPAARPGTPHAHAADWHRTLTIRRRSTRRGRVTSPRRRKGSDFTDTEGE